MSIKKIVAIGISTGGPSALSVVVKKLPANLPAPVLVVQHMPVGFTGMFAKRLNDSCRVRVKEAVDGDVLENSVVYIAKGDTHMEVVSSGKTCRLSLNDGEKMSGHKPSVDKMFLSLLKLDPTIKIVSVLMTGMGSDGARGMLKLKQRGARTIIQNKESSVVFGMPGAAKKLGAVDVELPLEEIANRIVRELEV